ncbi:MAG: 4'-phosphopantetheinyl transferase superfamily protein [Gammaproteobacteria bacterium]|nr:4'-phosphopantetheinyl transferase superfamily protein [Gammaproteobacteria bacterium]
MSPAALAPKWEAHAAERIALQPGSIHLWAAETARLQSAETLLSAEERASLARQRAPARRAMALGGRAGLRMLLRAYTGIANRELRFRAGARGKPMLDNRLDGGELCFNYSLSGGRALFAFAWNRQLGVDLEVAPRRIAAEQLARRKLGAEERRAWRAFPPRERDAAMLACWTRKEAYGKALGVGIRYFLHRAPVCAHLDSPAWSCGVRGQFAPSEDARVLHGLQIATPFAAAAALVYDGDALADDDGGASLQCHLLRSTK